MKKIYSTPVLEMMTVKANACLCSSANIHVNNNIGTDFKPANQGR